MEELMDIDDRRDRDEVDFGEEDAGHRREEHALETEAEAHEPDETTGEVLGISAGPPPEERETVPPGAPGDRTRARTEGADEPGAGARDVTGSRGSTGPVTGGHGATPRRSGATGTDIGEN